MTLWELIPQKMLKGDNPWEPWYDKAFGFIIRAETEYDARKLAHENAGDENGGYFATTINSPWLDEKYSSCKRLVEQGDAGVVLRNFAAA